MQEPPDLDKPAEYYPQNTCGLHKLYAVDNWKSWGSCGTGKKHPQTAVYDISRIISRFAPVFHNFPKFYYYDKNLFYFFSYFRRKRNL